MLYVEQLEHRVFLTSSWCFLYGLLSEMVVIMNRVFFAV